MGLREIRLQEIWGSDWLDGWNAVEALGSAATLAEFLSVPRNARIMLDMPDEPNDSEDATMIVLDNGGSAEYAAFFEDDGETGYLYVSDLREREIIQHVQVYVKARELDVKENDVSVIWSRDGTKCGVLIWGGMRGIIDVANNIEGRVLVEDRTTPPIDDRDWLDGFH